MSQPMSAYPASRARTMPQGEEVASFATYPEAQAAVDSLSDDGFPVHYLAIVGTDLRQVENITGRMSWGRAVASGAASGLWLGVLVGAMLSFFGNGAPTGGASFLMAMLLGIVWGILFQVVSYALTRGRRDFTSTSAVIASRYSIIAAQQAAQAAQALSRAPGNLTRGGAAARRAEERRAARDSEPTAFGSRPDEQPRFGVRLSDVGAEPGGDVGTRPGADDPAAGTPSEREA
ncbi:general stress protein [Actinomyces respiraculi]|uniref:general stress protein n=1 Tax=Actinomyces respiraculi TaxID=2744574 RepID=UPI001F3A0DA1|nr:general stress protein [Actinomyces respiraculi]